MLRVPTTNPFPDFETFRKVLKGEKEPERVHFVEVLVDEEIKQYMIENVRDKKWVPAPAESSVGDTFSRASLEYREAYWRRNMNFFYRMGYDFLPDMDPAAAFFPSIVPKPCVADDTASLSRGKRIWAEGHTGMITSWQDFEKFPWRRRHPLPWRRESWPE